MISIKKRTYPKIFGAIAVIYAALFLAYYAINHLAYDKLAENDALFNALENVRYFIYDGIEFIVPAVIAVITLVHITDGRLLRGFLLATVLSLGKFTYNFFYFYLYHTALGYEWLIAILGSLAVTAGYAVALAVYSTAIAYVGRIVLNKLKVTAAQIGERSPIYDFSSGTTKGVFAICLSCLGVEFVIEATNVITFFAEYGSNYAVGEIVFMAVCLAYLPVMLLVSQLVAMRIKNAFVTVEKKEKNKKKRS